MLAWLPTAYQVTFRVPSGSVATVLSSVFFVTESFEGTVAFLCWQPVQKTGDPRNCQTRSSISRRGPHPIDCSHCKSEPACSASCGNTAETDALATQLARFE